MNARASKLAQSMRRDWDDRARKDAFFYIASWKHDWDNESFLRSGEEDYRRLVEEVLQRLNFSTAGKTMLELGCGAGRMTRSFARRFERVIAFDVSPEMLDRARRLHSEVPGVGWLVGNGTDLSGVPTGSVDFVFSYLVLQHLPDERLVRAYVAEIMRVLADGGLCLFQFNGSNRHNMNWKGRMAWRMVDLLWLLRLQRASRWTANLMGLDPEMGGKNWHGVAMPSEKISATIRDSGGLVLEQFGVNTPMAWCCARKASSAGEQLSP
jgi:ubiquinone/menaquinone biosynthesis C-methylase UbiE